VGGAVLESISRELLYEVHSGETAARLNHFDYTRHSLFAFSKDSVALYESGKYREFFIDLLNSERAVLIEPFYRLSLALESGQSRLLVSPLQDCIQKVVLEAPQFADAWAQDLASQVAMNRKLGLSLRREQFQLSSPAEQRLLAHVFEVFDEATGKTKSQVYSAFGSRGSAVWMTRRLLSNTFVALLMDLDAVGDASKEELLDVSSALAEVARGAETLRLSDVSLPYYLQRVSNSYKRWLESTTREERQSYMRDLKIARRKAVGTIRGPVLLQLETQSYAILDLYEPLRQVAKSRAFPNLRSAIDSFDRIRAKEATSKDADAVLREFRMCVRMVCGGGFERHNRLAIDDWAEKNLVYVGEARFRSFTANLMTEFEVVLDHRPTPIGWLHEFLERCRTILERS
jgi:hypothetical protein